MDNEMDNEHVKNAESLIELVAGKDGPATDELMAQLAIAEALLAIEARLATIVQLGEIWTMDKIERDGRL